MSSITQTHVALFYCSHADLESWIVLFIHPCGLWSIWSHVSVMWNQWQRPPVTNPLFSSAPHCRVHPAGGTSEASVGSMAEQIAWLCPVTFIIFFLIIISVAIVLSIWTQWSWLTWMKVWKVRCISSLLWSTALDAVWPVWNDFNMTLSSFSFPQQAWGF